MSKHKHWGRVAAAVVSVGVLGTFTQIVSADDTTPQTVSQTTTQYVAVKDKAAKLYATLDGNATSGASLYQHTYQVKSTTTKAGHTYLGLQDATGKFIGYIDQTSTTTANGPQGAYYSANKYAMVTPGATVTYSDFSLSQVKKTNAQLANHTYHITGEYHHLNGKTIASLYDADGTWQGYVDESTVKPTNVQSGTMQPLSEYIVITDAKQKLWGNLNFGGGVSAKAYVNQTLSVSGEYFHANGSTYLAVNDAQGKLIGYLNAKFATVVDNQAGKWYAANGFATLLQKGKSIYADHKGTIAKSFDAVLGHTYKITGQYHYANGTTVYSIYDQNHKWVGYVRAQDITKGNNAQGPWQAQTGYAQVINSDFSIWKSFSWRQASSTSKLNGQVIKINGVYHHANGNTYYSVYTQSGKWLGYLSSSALKLVSSAQGDKLADNRYVTITHKGYSLYSSFNWGVKQTGSAAYGQTLISKGKYHHINGNTYLSLYDHAGNWRGYINQAGVSVASGTQGAWMKAGGYLTFTDKSVNAYSDFAATAEKTSGASLYGHTYKVTGTYTTFDGVKLYSVYNNDGKWLGYVKASQAKLQANAQGAWIAANGYVSTTKKGVTLWSGLNFHNGKSTNSSRYYRKTYQIKGEYWHANGSLYYALYDAKGQLMGYVNAKLVTKVAGQQGQWYSHSGSVEVTSKGYPIWKGFFSDQAGSTSDTKYYRNVYKATGVYYHFNGSTYLSLYSGKTWIGYVNAKATTFYGSQVMNVPYYSQMSPIYAPDGCAAAAMSMLLDYRGVNVSLRYMLNNLPMWPNVPGGQRGNVYTGKDFKYVITPGTLAAYGQRFSKGIKNISGVSTQTIINHILAGHPVLYYGFSPYQRAGVYTRNHCHVIVGYDSKKGFKIMDPAYYSAFSKAGSAGGNPTYDHGAVYWKSIMSFTAEYSHSYAGEAVSRAIVSE